METAIKIVLVDDHQIVLDGLKSLLDADDAFEVLAAVNSGEQALITLEKNQPHILLSDFSLPGINGLELSTIVKEKYPSVKRVLLSMHDEAHLIRQIMKTGVDGYLLKSIEQVELKQALRQIYSGLPYMSPEITKMILTDLSGDKKEELLTERELEILKLIVKEYSNKAIAEKLFISERTVETHRKNIFRKTNTGSLVGLVKFAFAQNLV